MYNHKANKKKGDVALSSAFKNFFITFVACLVVFGFVGFQFAYPWLSEALSLNGTSEASEDVSAVSGEDSTDTEVSDGSGVDAKGDIFTALITCESESGSVLASAFIDANGQTKRFVYCRIPANATVYGESGVLAPVSDMFSENGASSVTSCVTAMTGVQTDYFLAVRRSTLPVLVSMMQGAYFDLSFDIKYVNPAYAGFTPTEGEGYPDDYYVFIPQGRIALDESTLSQLLAYNPNLDGSEYNTVYLSICRTLITQFFTSQVQNVKNTDRLAVLLAACRTNITSDDVSKHLDTIFTYSTYQLKEMDYPTRNWQNAVKTIREADGRYD